MTGTKPTMVQQVAQTVGDSRQQGTGHAPKAVTVVLGAQTPAITLGATVICLEECGKGGGPCPGD